MVCPRLEDHRQLSQGDHFAPGTTEGRGTDAPPLLTPAGTTGRKATMLPTRSRLLLTAALLASLAGLAASSTGCAPQQVPGGRIDFDGCLGDCGARDVPRTTSPGMLPSSIDRARRSPRAYRNRPDRRKFPATPIQLQPLIGYAVTAPSAKVLRLTFTGPVSKFSLPDFRLVNTDGTVGPTPVSATQTSPTVINLTYTPDVNATQWFCYMRVYTETVRGTTGGFIDPTPSVYLPA